MACCRSGGTSDDYTLELVLVEARERSVTIAFHAPRVVSRDRFSFRGNQVELRFLVSVIGGPHGDLYGAKQEVLEGIQCGARVEHEVKNLCPETEYSITVSLNTEVLPSCPQVNERLDARTAASATAVFAGEELHGWGQGRDVKGSDDLKKEKPFAGKTSSANFRPSASAAAAVVTSSSAAAAVPDDSSTNAPSEGAEVTHNRFDELSDSGSETGVAPAPEEQMPVEPDQTAVVATAPEGGIVECEIADAAHPLQMPGDMIVSSDEPTIVEVPTPVPQGCNLCQMFDWFRRTPPTTAATELLLQDSTSRIAARQRRELEREEQPATVSDPPRPKRGQRPYRIPFPGTPVDPASVGISVPRKQRGTV